MTNYTQNKSYVKQWKQIRIAQFRDKKENHYQLENTSPPPPNARDNLPGRKECGLILHATRQERADKSVW